VKYGKSWVVDMDLEAFFDNVNHDILMSMIARSISDKKLLKLIRSFLNAGMMQNGLVSKRDVGTPQGGLCKALHNPPYAKKVIMLSNILHLSIFNNLSIFYFA